MKVFRSTALQRALWNYDCDSLPEETFVDDAYQDHLYDFENVRLKYFRHIRRSDDWEIARSELPIKLPTSDFMLRVSTYHDSYDAIGKWKTPTHIVRLRQVCVKPFYGIELNALDLGNEWCTFEFIEPWENSYSDQDMEEVKKFCGQGIVDVQKFTIEDHEKLFIITLEMCAKSDLITQEDVIRSMIESGIDRTVIAVKAHSMGLDARTIEESME